MAGITSEPGARQGGDAETAGWPDPFPGFAGIFTVSRARRPPLRSDVSLICARALISKSSARSHQYEVDLASDGALGSEIPDFTLGSGVYLWKLEILAETFKSITIPDKYGNHKVTCQLRKTLVDVPSNAGGASRQRDCQFAGTLSSWRRTQPRSAPLWPLLLRAGAPPAALPQPHRCVAPPGVRPPLPAALALPPPPPPRPAAPAPPAAEPLRPLRPAVQ